MLNQHIQHMEVALSTWEAGIAQEMGGRIWKKRNFIEIELQVK